MKKLQGRAPIFILEAFETISKGFSVLFLETFETISGIPGVLFVEVFETTLEPLGVLYFEGYEKLQGRDYDLLFRSLWNNLEDL